MRGARILTLGLALLAVGPGSAGAFAPAALAAQDVEALTGTIRGTVVDAVTGKPVPGASVRLRDGGRAVTSDGAGRFLLEDVPVGGRTVSFEHLGYHTLALPDVMVHPTRATEVRAEVSVRAWEVEGLEVGSGYFRRDDGNPTSVARFSVEEVRRAPGLGTDVSRTLAALPSMAQLGEGNNDLLVRGGSSIENGFYVDGIPVPNINHFPAEGQTGGPIGMLNVGFLRDVRASVGGFSAEHGDRLSSIIDIDYREGNRNEVDGELQLGLAGVGGSLEGPIAGGRGSWMASVQRSYLELLVDAIGTGVAPTFGDVQGKAVYDLDPAHRLEVLALAGWSAISADSDEGLMHDDHYGDYAARQWTAGLAWDALWSDRTRSSTSVSVSRVGTSEGFYGVHDDRTVYEGNNADRGLTLRSVTSRSGGGGSRIDIGGEATLTSARYDYVIGADTAGAAARHSRQIVVDERMGAVRAAAFVSGTARPLERVSTTAGLRAEHSSVHGATVLTPRLSLAVDVTDALRLTGAAGAYAQALPLFMVSQNEANRDLPHIRARHWVLGAEYLVTPAMQVTIEGYRKDYRDFPLDPTHPERFPVDDAVSGFGMQHGALTGGGRARAEGLEAILQHKRVDRFHALASAAWFRTRYRGLDGVWRDRLYDNRLIVQATAGYELSRGWDVSARWLYGGGAPYTPIDVDASAASHRTVFDFSRTNAERLDAYHALNLRVEHRRYFRGSSLTSYLTLTNAYGRDNVRMYQWSASRGEVEPVRNLGFLPVLGLEYRF